MIEYLKNLFGIESNETVIPAPDTMQMYSDKATVGAFTDPNNVPAEVAMELVDTVVAAHPDADKLREALALRFIKENGIDMYGTAIHDHIHNLKGNPDTNPDTLYVTPYARPTASAIVMPTYQTDNGDIFVAMVKNWNDELDHSKGAETDWRFPGGYMEPRFPQDEQQAHHDDSLLTTAKREIKEYLGLDIQENVQTERLFVRDGCQINNPNKKAHPIDAFYIADFARQSEAPPVRAGSDVAIARWVNINDISYPSSPPSFSGYMNVHNAEEEGAGYSVNIDGKQEPIRGDHAELLEKGIAKIRESIMPLHDHDATQFNSQLSEEAAQHYDKVAQAHGFPANITININSGQNFAEKVAASQGAETNQAVH